MQNMSLGALTAVLGGPVAPVDTGGEPDVVPVATEGTSDAPVPLAAPAGDTAPTEGIRGILEPISVPEIVETGFPMDSEAPTALFMAPGPVSPVAGPLASDLEPLLHTPPGTCPRPPVVYIPAGKHQDKLNVNPRKVDITQYGNLIGKDLKLDMSYVELENGAAYCVDRGSGTETVVVGGTFLFETVDGDCVPPPQNGAGSPCCTIYMWQPNARGFYYDNCSMQYASSLFCVAFQVFCRPQFQQLSR